MARSRRLLRIDISCPCVGRCTLRTPSVRFVGSAPSQDAAATRLLSRIRLMSSCQIERTCSIVGCCCPAPRPGSSTRRIPERAGGVESCGWADSRDCADRPALRSGACAGRSDCPRLVIAGRRGGPVRAVLVPDADAPCVSGRSAGGPEGLSSAGTGEPTAGPGGRVAGSGEPFAEP